MTMHVRVLAAGDLHHTIEAVFKAFGKALRQAVAPDPAGDRHPLDQRGPVSPAAPSAKAGALYIVDYGSGNLRSVQKAFEHVGVPAVVGSDPRAMSDAAALVLPGVGAFGAAMAQLESKGLVEPLLKRHRGGRAFPGRLPGPAAALRSQRGRPGSPGAGVDPGRRARAAVDGQGAAHRLEPGRVVRLLRSVRRTSRTAPPSTSCTATRWCPVRRATFCA